MIRAFQLFKPLPILNLQTFFIVAAFIDLFVFDSDEPVILWREKLSSKIGIRISHRLFRTVMDLGHSLRMKMLCWRNWMLFALIACESLHLLVYVRCRCRCFVLSWKFKFFDCGFRWTKDDFMLKQFHDFIVCFF